MGSGSSTISVLTQDILEEYTILTYLTKAEIMHLYKIFGQLDSRGSLQNMNFRFPCEVIEDIFTQLKFNPFKDRIFKVFSSEKDGLFSFEDMLDLCSVMSDRCPEKVKAAWAFRIYDFDEDEALGEEDMMEVMKRLTASAGLIPDNDQKHIVQTLLQEMDLESNGSIGQLEFEHAIGKMSEFPHSFCFRL